jgi:serine protease Do
MRAQALLKGAVSCIVLAALCQAPLGAQAADPRAAKPAAGGRIIFANTIADVAEAAKPSVVHIDTTGTMLQQLPMSGRFGFHAPQDSSAVVPVRALGSGVVLDKEGRILTNNHVVEYADSISVQFFDGSTKPAKLIGADPFSDLAVLQVDVPSDVPAANFGDSDSMRVGDWVVAIGSPQGLDWTVTAGIISAKHRGHVGEGEATGLEDYIQTDAPINPGNSGGPLLNLDGQVIGINTLIVSQSNGSEGLGFAIPASMVKSISDSLINLGKVIRGDLGLKSQDLTAAIATGLNLPEDTVGVAVVQVIPEGPADSAGLKQGDVILRYAGAEVSSSLNLKRAISASMPGDSVSIDYIREGAIASIDVTVEDQYALQKLVSARPSYKLLGLRVRALESEEAQNLGLESNSGVIITQVVPGSPADQANLNVGDTIFRVGSAEVTNPDDFRDKVAEAVKSGSVLLLIHDASTGMVGYLQVKLKG